MDQFAAFVHVVWIVALGNFWGQRILVWAKYKFDSELERTAFGFAAGFGSFGLLLAILGSLGFFSASACYLFFISLTVLLFFGWKDLPPWNPRLIFEALQKSPLLWALSAVLALAIIQSMTPSTAHDALAYQLEIPKRFALAHRICYVPYGVNSVFPLLMNMFYVLSLLWDGTRMANLFHCVTGLGIVIGLLAIERRFIPKSWLGISALIFALTPGIFGQMSLAYTDVALSFFIFFVFYSILKWQETADLKWFVLAGIYLGFAFGVKYLAALAAISVTAYLIVLASLRKIKLGPALAGLFLMASISFLIGFAWYFRSFLYEGSFLYFGEKGYIAKNLGYLNSFALPWSMTMHPQYFGGSWTRLGIIFLAFLPGLFLIRKKPAAANTFLFWGIIYFCLWTLLPRQNLRFLFPVCALWSLPIGHLIASGFPEKWLTKWSRIFIFAILIIEAGAAFYHGRNSYRVALGLETEEDYLKRTERTYAVAQFVNTNLPENAKILNAYEVRMFHFRPEVIREPEFRQKTHYDTRFATSEETVDFLKRAGITHVLIAPSDAAEKQIFPPRNIRQLVSDAQVGKSRFKELYREPSQKDSESGYTVLSLI